MRPLHYTPVPVQRHDNSAIHLIGGILMLIFWAVVIWGIVLLINKHAGRHDAGRVDTDPLDIAKLRYAKGEITKEEFTQIKKDLA